MQYNNKWSIWIKLLIKFLSQRYAKKNITKGDKHPLYSTLHAKPNKLENNTKAEEGKKI